MKRTALALSLILALLFSAVTGAVFIDLATANPAPLFAFPTEPVTTLPTIVVHSPVQNQTYSSTDVWLNFSIVKPETWFAIDVAHHADHSPLTETFVNITSVYYVVDGVERQNIPVHDIDSLFDTPPTLTLNFSTVLPLTVGAHTVKVSLQADSYYVVRYDLSDPFSSVELYADSNPVNFTAELVIIAKPEPFPTIPFVVAASGASVAIVGVGLLVYFKKRKH
jgi:hypothetical protein